MLPRKPYKPPFWALPVFILAAIVVPPQLWNWLVAKRKVRCEECHWVGDRSEMVYIYGGWFCSIEEFNSHQSKL